MSPQLYGLAYFSHNALHRDPDGREASIAAILDTARRNNARRGVTGALLYSEGCFAQVLEGTLAAVDSTFEAIERDPRHREVTLLHLHPIEARTFGAWSMGYAGAQCLPPELESVIDAGAAPDASEAVRLGKARSVVRVLHDLMSQEDARRADRQPHGP